MTAKPQTTDGGRQTTEKDAWRIGQGAKSEINESLTSEGRG